jgi:hypothetical protein
MPEQTRDISLDAILALLKQVPPERVSRLLADIRLSEFAEVRE